MKFWNEISWAVSILEGVLSQPHKYTIAVLSLRLIQLSSQNIRYDGGFPSKCFLQENKGKWFGRQITFTIDKLLILLIAGWNTNNSL